MNTSKVAGTLICIGLLVAPYAHRPSHAADPAPKPVQSAGPKGQATGGVMEARDKGLTWLTKNQKPDGSWGKTYTVAVTSFACLSYLAAADEPFTGPHAGALTKGLAYLMKMQKSGQWPKQGHSWIHGQSFATLTLSEAAGRGLLCKTQPDIDVESIRKVVAQAVKVIAANQSSSGGWWYTPGAKGQHEGSTTVCAVQALVSAANYGVPIDEEVLEKGFEYLKKCQNNDGGFDYMLNPSKTNTSMKEGTAADVATLGLMRKFDYAVMMNGYKFLLKITPAGITSQRFPYYGHFYGCMGMRLLGQEFKSFRDKTGGYLTAAQKDIVAWQVKDGSWPVRSWVKNAGEPPAYATAFATLLLGVNEGRLSIFNRKPPKLPKEAEA